MTISAAIQDDLTPNHCLGCGVDNAHGLGIRSTWCGPLETSCVFQPQPHMAAGPPTVLNGGIIATVVDCHAVCTAIAHARRGTEAGSGAPPWYATGTLEIRYLRPAAVDAALEVRARITRATDRKTIVECTALSGGEVCAEATVVAVRVPASWLADAAADPGTQAA